jgi:serine/threonine protein kinase
MTKLFSAVSFLSTCRKYENILFIDNNPRAEIKLIDFGLSKRFGHEDMTEGVGTV